MPMRGTFSVALIMDLRDDMTPEQRLSFDRQRARRKEPLDQQTVELALSRLRQQRGVPINALDPIQRGSWRAHRGANTRRLTANEQGAQRQRQEARQQAEQVRTRVNEEDYLQQLQTAASQDPFLYTQFTTIIVAPRRPESPFASKIHQITDCTW
jgi:hypothetical protein